MKCGKGVRFLLVAILLGLWVSVTGWADSDSDESSIFLTVVDNVALTVPSVLANINVGQSGGMLASNSVSVPVCVHAIANWTLDLTLQSITSSSATLLVPGANSITVNGQSIFTFVGQSRAVANGSNTLLGFCPQVVGVPAGQQIDVVFGVKFSALGIRERDEVLDYTFEFLVHQI